MSYVILNKVVIIWAGIILSYGSMYLIFFIKVFDLYEIFDDSCTVSGNTDHL